MTAVGVQTGKDDERDKAMFGGFVFYSFLL